MTAYRKNARESLADLDDSEKRILVNLVRLLVRSDGALTGAEREQIEHIAQESGDDTFWKLMDASAASADDAETILGQAEGVEDKDAQEMIYGTLYELSLQDGTDSGENDVLDRLAAAWELKITDVP